MPWRANVIQSVRELNAARGQEFAQLRAVNDALSQRVRQHVAGVDVPVTHCLPEDSAFSQGQDDKTLSLVLGHSSGP